MKKGIVALAAAAMLAVPVATASAQTILRVPDPTPTGTFTDAQGNAGYGEIRDDGIRACNENPGTPAGDNLSGYAWIDAGGDANSGNTNEDGNNGVTYGSSTVGAGDYDGEGADDEDVNGNGTLDPGEDTNGNGQLDTDTSDCPGVDAP